VLIVLGVALITAAVAWYRWLPGWERRSFPRFAEALDRPWYYWVHIVGGASLLLAVGLLVLVDGLAHL
jgi:hypothetical protein